MKAEVELSAAIQEHPQAVVDQQLLGAQVGDNGVQVAVAVDVTKIRLRAVGHRRRQMRRAEVREHAA